MPAARQVPSDPAIFHITHVDNLAGIIREGGLWSDAERIARHLVTRNIALTHIKQRRLSRVVQTAFGGTLGDYVPFNFCPRSVMLCSIWKQHADYAGGQDSIIHLVSTVSRATALGRPFAFTDRHAELAYASHFDDLARLGEVPWETMPMRQWAAVKQERQAEFLVHGFFAWTAVAGIAVRSAAVADVVRQILATATHQPPVTTRPDWYY